MRFLSPLLAIFLAPLLIAQSPGIEVHLVSLNASPGNNITVEVLDQNAHPVANAAVVFRLPEGSPQPTFADGSSSAVVYSDSNGRAQLEGIHWSAANHPGPVPVRVTAVKGTDHAGLLSELNPPVSAAPQPAPRIIAEKEPARVGAPSVAVATSSAAVAAARPVPGALPVVADDESLDANVPLRHTLTTGAAEGLAPAVSITSSGHSSASGSKTKWLIVLAVAAAGAGTAFALTHKGSASSSSSSSGVSIGAPTVSVGHP